MLFLPRPISDSEWRLIINHNVASENNNDNLVNEVVAKDHINVEKESGPKLVSEVVATGWSNY